MKFLILFLVFFSLNSWAKPRYLEIALDLGACINAKMLPKSAHHGKTWKMSAHSLEEGELRITSGHHKVTNQVGRLKHYSKLYSGPVITIVVAIDDEKTSEVTVRLEETKRGPLRSDQVRELKSFHPQDVTEHGLWIGKEYWNSGHCMSVF